MTQAHEARNGSSSASQQAARSNIPSPNLSDNFEIKRDGLTASVYRAPSGQWAWRLMDSLQDEIGGGSGYDTEGDAANDALAELTAQDARIERGGIPREAPQPKGRDADTLARTISEIDAIVQSEAESLSATANLARRAVIAARKQVSGALQSLLGDLSGVLATLSYQAGDLSNTVNGEAEAVGCNHVRDWDEVHA
ncbi:hypothetical protein THIX_30705 [Thiomonas sp. X19]|uniref:hypothetical protein n=1 Tax=Thiomonas sp. X19 TaxID=1050370 RepID=UPI000B6BDDA0|nr:hypothetical protein [Thiomonas sp. X19]SCC93477.1 hypothetical protein THIX_30705 [Thiomonas sp. X19]